MAILKNKTIYLCSFLTIMLGLIPVLLPVNPYIVLAVCMAFPVITSMLVMKKTINYEHVAILMLGTIPFIHSVTIGGIHFSLPDILLLFSFVYLIASRKLNLDIPKMFLFLSVLYTIYYFVALYWTDDISKSIPRLVQYVEFLIIGVIVFYNTSKLDLQKKMLAGYVAVSTSVSVIAIGIYATQDTSGALYILGWHKNALGWIVGVAIPIIYGMFFLYRDKTKKVKLVLMAAFLLNFLTLILTISRGALLGAVAGLLVFLIFINRKRLVLFVSAMLAACLFIFVPVFAPAYLETGLSFDEGSSAYSRILLFQHVSSYIAEQPFIGYGAGNYFVSLPHINFSQEDPNNSFLLNLVEGGAIGLILFVLLIGYVFRAAWKNKKQFKNDYERLVLNAILFAVFFGRFLHTQVDVTWVRGSSLIMFGVAGMLLALNASFTSNKEAVVEKNNQLEEKAQSKQLRSGKVNLRRIG